MSIDVQRGDSTAHLMFFASVTKDQRCATPALDSGFVLYKHPSLKPPFYAAEMAGVVYDGIGSYMLSSVELISAHVLPNGSGLLVGQIVVIKLY